MICLLYFLGVSVGLQSLRSDENCSTSANSPENQSRMAQSVGESILDVLKSASVSLGFEVGSSSASQGGTLPPGAAAFCKDSTCTATGLDNKPLMPTIFDAVRFGCVL